MLRSDDVQWKAIVKNAAAATTTAVLVVIGLVPGDWRRIALAGLGAVVIGPAIYAVFTFYGHLLQAPKKYRISRQVSAGQYRSSVIGSIRIRRSDVMQQEAALIARAIDEYRERRRKGIAEQTNEQEGILHKISMFRERAETDILSRKSRKRSLELYEEMSSSLPDFDVIEKLCRAFVKLNPAD